MPRTSILRQRLDAHEPILALKCNIPHPMVIELMGLNGIECIWLDCEHFPIGIDAMAGLIQACRGANMDSLVRIPNGAYALAGQMLDAGANAIMYPRCMTAEDVAELVQWARFAPLGRRGLDNGMTAGGYGLLGAADYIAIQNREPVLVVQIETQEAVDNLDAICAVPGIDMLFFGPGDFSAAIGMPGEMRHPRVKDALEKVADAADRHGLAWGTPALSLDVARELLALGATLLTTYSDTTALRLHAVKTRQDFANLGIPFSEA